MKAFPSSSPAPRQRDAGKAAVQTPRQPQAGAFSVAPAQVRAVHPASQPQQRAVPPTSQPQQRHQSASSSGPSGLVQVPVPLRRPPATPQACGSTSELECLVKACALGKDEALVRSALGLSPIPVAQDSASLPHPAPAKAAMSDKKAQVVSTAGKLSTKMITGAKSRVLSMRAAAANPDKQHHEPKSSKEKVPSAKAYVPSQMQKRTITPSARGVPPADSKRHKHVQQSQVPVETPSELVPKESVQAPLEDDIPIAEYLETSFEDMLEDSTVVKKASLARAPRTRAKQIGATPKIRGQRYEASVKPPSLDRQPNIGDEVSFRDFTGCTVAEILEDGFIQVDVPELGKYKAAPGKWKLKSVRRTPSGGLEHEICERGLGGAG